MRKELTGGDNPQPDWLRHVGWWVFVESGQAGQGLLYRLIRIAVVCRPGELVALQRPAGRDPDLHLDRVATAAQSIVLRQIALQFALEQIGVIVEGVDVLFEPDEERNYRAMAIDTERVNMEKLDKNLLQVICLTLDQLFG